MVVSPEFQFSQASLQDFQECRQRFYLRYVKRLSWPALESEPALISEDWMKQGAYFHRLVHQYLIGVPTGNLSATVTGESLGTWWNNFLSNNTVDLSNKIFPERMVSTKIEGFNLVAKFDLVEVDSEGSMIIYDWKTSRHPGSRSYLSSRLQTRVYPYVLTKAGYVLVNGGNVWPEKIRMVYWFASKPQEPEIFSYNKEKLHSDEQILLTLIKEICSLKESIDFTKTENRNHCRYCVYRSLCDRGDQAGPFNELEYDITGEIENELDFDQIPEIEF